MVHQAYSISVIVSGDVNYTDPATSARIDSLIESLENSTYINQHLSKSWLHDFRTVTRAQVNQNMHIVYHPPINYIIVCEADLYL